jgi:VWFA-related protein
MREPFKSSILPTAALAMLLTPLSALAQDAATSFGESVDVRVVNVEAVVTDRAGTRVLGLTPGDFQLLVDGEEVPIDFFTEFRGGEALRDVGSSPWEIAPISNVQAEGTSYLVFVDDFFSIRVDRNRVLRALQDELAFLGAEDRMAIVAWDGVRTEMLSTWTSNERELRRALQTAANRPAEGLNRIAERRSILSGTYLPISAGFLGGRGLAITERVYSEILIDQVESAVNAANATLRGFAAPPGRKVMLLASGGWPFRPVEFVTGDPFAAALDRRFEQGEEIYGPLAETANLLGYTLYPIDAPGLEGNSRVDASRGASALLGAISLSDYRETDLHDSLRFLARETGGRALLNGQRAQPLSLVSDDTRSFYWLGFNPDRTGDGEVRSIELRVKQKGLEARTRTGYRDLAVEEEITMQVASALMFGFPAHSQGLAVELGSSQRDRRKTMIVPITVRLPASAIALLPAGDQYAADLEVRVAAIDDRGDRSGITTLPWRVTREQLPERDEDLAFETVLRLRRATQDLVVAVYDTNSGELFSALSSIVPSS